MKSQWQIDQGDACGCRGHDDMCPCQNVERSNWFLERRIEWIAESLRIFGFINRAHIERKFFVSTPQASADLKEFQRRFPEAIQYDRRGKRYVSATRPTNSGEDDG